MLTVFSVQTIAAVLCLHLEPLLNIRFFYVFCILFVVLMCLTFALVLSTDGQFVLSLISSQYFALLTSARCLCWFCFMLKQTLNTMLSVQTVAVFLFM